MLFQHCPRDVRTLRGGRGARLRQLRLRQCHARYHLGRQGTPVRGPLAPGPRHGGEVLQCLSQPLVSLRRARQGMRCPNL
eukprot:15464651-Alexandrium_andersonii.AAC.1